MIEEATKRKVKDAAKEMLTLHDLRAAGFTRAAQSGATARDLMDRGGHSTIRAAMIYQRSATERGAIIAANMDDTLRGKAAS